ncbi:UNVERIFIED_CONTAM: Transcription initiation factor TFIID subunit 13 [Sesamum indicum]
MNNTTAGSSSKVRPGSSQPSETSLKRKRGMFQKDCESFSGNSLFPIILRFMFYRTYFSSGCNSAAYDPLPETVALAEDIVVEYVTDMVHKAQDIASKRGKLLTEDFLFLIRKDLPKLNRCTELLSMNEELKQARKAFEVDEEKLASID